MENDANNAAGRNFCGMNGTFTFLYVRMDEKAPKSSGQ